MKKELLLIILFAFSASFSQVGINTTDPKSSLDINGNLSVKVVTLNSNISPTLIDDGVYISINPQYQDQEFKLPSAVAFPGRIYFIRNINNTNTAKLTSAAGDFFFKGSTSGINVLYMFENHYRTLEIISDGTNWTVLEYKI
jgi:hypothetical protein